MASVRWKDVEEREKLIIFIYFTSWDVTRDDFAEKAIVHTINYLPFFLDSTNSREFSKIMSAS